MDSDGGIPSPLAGPHQGILRKRPRSSPGIDIGLYDDGLFGPPLFGTPLSDPDIDPPAHTSKRYLSEASRVTLHLPNPLRHTTDSVSQYHCCT